MKFSELVRLLETNGFSLVRENPEGEVRMIDLPYSLVIEATEEPDFFGFYSPDLEGFTGVGHSIEDCIYRAKWGMREHVDLLREQGLPVPPTDCDPRITVQNEKKNAAA